MNADTLKDIVELTSTNWVQEFDGIEHSLKKIHPIIKPAAPHLCVFTLRSLLDYLPELDQDEIKGLMIHVESPTMVRLLPIRPDKYSRRVTVVQADVSGMLPRFQSGQRYDQEEFLIKVQTSFHIDANAENLLKTASVISVGDVSDIEDDGVTQTVSTKRGVHLKGKTNLPNPVMLKPFLTFPEISPIERPYIFRVFRDRSGEAEMSLFTSDSRDWEISVTNSIKEYLNDRLMVDGINDLIVI